MRKNRTYAGNVTAAAAALLHTALRRTDQNNSNVTSVSFVFVSIGWCLVIGAVPVMYGAAVWCVVLQGAGYPEPEQRSRRAEASAADDGHGRNVEELRHDGRHRGTGTLLLCTACINSTVVRCNCFVVSGVIRNYFNSKSR